MVSKHFSLNELTFSDFATRNGVNNQLAEDSPKLAALKDLCCHILEPLREALGKPILITSGYRSPMLNRLIGGSKTSQHCFGQAADFHVDGMTTEQLFQKIIKLDLPYDQIIREFATSPTGGWIHCSYRPNPRKAKLSADKVKGATVYSVIS